MSTRQLSKIEAILLLALSCCLAKAADPTVFTKSQLEQLIPVNSTGISRIKCPKCGNSRFSWNYKTPTKMQCTKCKTSFPSTKFKMDKSELFLNNIGETYTEKYYLKHGKKYFLNACIDAHKQRFMLNHLENTVKQYKTTKNRASGKQIADILKIYTKRYKHYAEKTDYEFVSTGGKWKLKGKAISKDKHPYPWGGGPWGRRWTGAMPIELIRAYAAIKDQVFLTKAEQDEFEKEIVDRSYDYYMSYPWKRHINNNIPCQISRIVEAGRLLKRPEYVHVGYRWVKEILKNDLFTFRHKDSEGPGYGYLYFMGLTGNFNSLRGYSDPPGYRHPKTGERIDNFQPENIAGYVESFNAPEAFVMPDGRMLRVNDTGLPKLAGWRVGYYYMPLPKESHSRLMSGFRAAVLGDGEGDEQVMSYLDFSNAGNHQHRDSLNMILFAHGRELFSEIGYRRNKLRTWAERSMGHNLVVIDRKYHGDTSCLGDIEVFSEMPGLSMVRASADKAYRGLARKYTRTLIQNTAEIDKPYLVDVFEVEGGRIHDYLLHGATQYEQNATTSLNMQKMPGERPLMEKGEKWVEPTRMRAPINCYGLFRNVTRAKLNGNAWVDFKIKDENIGTRTHFVKNPKLELFLAESPSLRIYDKSKPDRNIYKTWMPQIILRNKSTNNGLKTVFIAVHEAYKDRSFIKSVNQLESSAGSVALQIDMGDRKDTYLISLHSPKTMQVDTLSTDGIMAAVSVKGKKQDEWLVGGSYLGHDKRLLRLANAYVQGNITSFPKPDEIMVDKPNGIEAGDLLIAKFYDEDRKEDFTVAFDISSVQGNKITFAYPHGIASVNSGYKEIYAPKRNMSKNVRFTIIKRTTTTSNDVVITPGKGRYTHTRVNNYTPFMDEVEVNLSPSGENVFYSTDGTYPSIPYRKPFVINNTCTVKALKANSNGITKPYVSSENYVKSLLPVKVKGLKPGVTYKYFQRMSGSAMPREEVYKKIAQFPEAKATDEGVVDNFKLISDSRGHATMFNGYISIPEDGIYTFYTRAETSAILHIDNVKVIDAFGRRDGIAFEGKVALRKGLHKIRLDYLTWTTHAVLEVEMSSDRIKRGPIPNKVLFHALR